MTDAPQSVDFDARPPMPVDEYEQTVKRVNVGYDLLFTLAGCFLRALHQPALNLLVVGAGGGAEIERFLPANPGWRLTGIDPSQDMLALARAKAEALGIHDRTSLLRGTVQDLPPDARFDAATCIFVLHFLPDDQKAALLKDIASRLRPDGLLILGSPVRPDVDGLGQEVLGAWQEYGELMGMPHDQMSDIVQRMAAQPGGTVEEDFERLLRGAGFSRVYRFCTALAIDGWIAR